MLTHSLKTKDKQKEKPWLLITLVLIWVLGTAFFHSAWEPYEPFVFAVVKSIISNDSWFVPYVSNAPYLEIQPFYFWLYSALIKLFDITNIANYVRIINTLIIISVVALSGIIGSNLKSMRNGRTVVLILISSAGFINNAYQLSPNILNLFGFCLYIYAIQLNSRLPGISGGILFVGLFLVSISFNCEFILIALILLFILPIVDSFWRNKNYFITVAIGVTLFLTIFYLYALQLQNVNSEFFLQWKNKYISIFNFNNILINIQTLSKMLVWYVLPSWCLVIWTFYKQGKTIFNNKIIQVNVLLALLLIIFTIFSKNSIENSIFPIVLCFAFIASIEIDSIRISIVSLLNYFSIIIFAVLGLTIWALYIMLNINKPKAIIEFIYSISQEYKYNFNIWQLSLAVIITTIWLFLITRRHIRGREMLSNWASGTTFVLILFLSLWLTWFDSVLTFKPMIKNSLKYINYKKCITTIGRDSSQIALWYYYANVNLMPSFIKLDYSLCDQAIVATDNIKNIDQKQWKILWRQKRPIDKKVYYYIKRTYS